MARLYHTFRDCPVLAQAKSQRADRTGWLPWRDSNRSASISNRSAGVICKLTSHANISETVRTIFRRYLDLRSMGAVIDDLDNRGIRNNLCHVSDRLRPVIAAALSR